MFYYLHYLTYMILLELIILFVIIFGVVVVSHELGHFLAAKFCKVGVEEFSLGMGPKIFSKKWGETKYSFNLINISIGYNYIDLLCR